MGAMSYVADLHIHSSYAMGTSPQLTLENLSAWAKIKGIDLLATGDFTHPVWRDELRKKISDSASNLFTYQNTNFVVGTEVNCVFQQSGRSHRVHLLIFAPSFEVVSRISALFRKWGNLDDDGRPLLTVSCRELTNSVMSIDDRCIVMPAHAWTPWFSVYGSDGGFDSLEECFGDASKAITAIETGLSSDPGMNWQVNELDNKTVVSFSDAHSLPRLGRELTVFKGELSYAGFRNALKTQGVDYTIEFFPEEGKYHYNGHRKCGVCQSPEETLAANNNLCCPKCGKHMTIGVDHRVKALSNKQVTALLDKDGFYRHPTGTRPPYRRMVALDEIISEAVGVGVGTKKVTELHRKLISALGSELNVLQSASVTDIASISGERIAEGIDLMRKGLIDIKPGYDGVYGSVKIWPEDSKQRKLEGF